MIVYYRSYRCPRSLEKLMKWYNDCHSSNVRLCNHWSVAKALFFAILLMDSADYDCTEGH